MKLSEFLQLIESTYNKHLPNSKCSATYKDNIYSSIFITCYLASDKSENSGGYWDNDMFSIQFHLDLTTGEFPKGFNLESEMPDNLNMEVNQNSYLLKPENPYMAYDRHKLSYRKVTGNSDKIITTLDKYFAKLVNDLKQDIADGLIHDGYLELVLNKLN